MATAHSQHVDTASVLTTGTPWTDANGIVSFAALREDHDYDAMPGTPENVGIMANTLAHPQKKEAEWLPSGHHSLGAEWSNLLDHSSMDVKQPEWSPFYDHRLAAEGAEWEPLGAHSSSRTNVAKNQAAATEYSLRSTGRRLERRLQDFEASSLALERAIFLLSMLCALGTMAMVAYMFAGGDNVASTRNPPAWNPDNSRTYSFRDWASDVLAWSMATNLDSRRKAAAVRLRLQGPAKRWARGLPPAALVGGGIIGGRHHDPMAFLMHSIAAHWGELGEETR